MFKSVNILKSISPEGVFQLNETSFDDILKNSHSNITLQLPIEGQLHNLELNKSELFSTDFNKKYSSQQISNRNLGTHYKGKLSGIENSSVAVSFTNLGFVGLILDGVSQYEISPIDENTYKIIPIDSFPQYECGATHHTNWNLETYNSTRVDVRKTIQGDILLKGPTATTRCINVYWEGDTDIYTVLGVNSESYLTSLFNAVQLLFSNDGIQLYLQDVFVNSGTSYYFPSLPSSSISAFDMLNEFTTIRNVFPGMAAQLFSFNKGDGGIAWLDTLCIQPYAYSRLYSPGFQQPPTYSWSVMVATHEHGHTFGSPHTMSCNWNTTNFQPGDNPRGCNRIDSCQVECGSFGFGCSASQLNPGYGYCYQTSGTDCGKCCPPDYCCGLPGLPPSGGTIMSYCHLSGGNGINLNLGFGPQPRQRIIDEINSLPIGCVECLGPPPEETLTPTPTVTKTPTPTPSLGISPNPTPTQTVTPSITKTNTPTKTQTPTCGGIITIPAIPPSSLLNLTSYFNNAYTNSGTIIHSPYNLDGTSPNNIYLAALTTQPVWRNSNLTDGPLNRSGKWAIGGSNPLNTWIGFADCVIAPETKTYWVGLGADNVFKLVVDGVIFVNTYNGPYDFTVCNCNTSFQYWHVYPITLSAGNHSIELYGLNRNLSAVFGCEIYDNTIDELTGATTVNDLNIIFSSSDNTVAELTQNISGQYLSSGYTCPDGYIFDSCSLTCYKYIDCNATPTPTPTITQTPNPSDCQYCLSLHPCTVNRFFWECCEPYSSIRIYLIPSSVSDTLVNGDTYYVEAIGFSGCAVYDSSLTTADFSYEYINIITP